MQSLVNPGTIFVPMLVLVALTFISFFRMAAARGAAIKAGQDRNYYRAQLGEPEPEPVRAVVRHWDNLFELPTLFYAACLTAYVINGVTRWTLVFAWGYVIGRVAQSTVHLTYNNPAHRGLGFGVGVLFLMALWIKITVILYSRM